MLAEVYLRRWKVYKLEKGWCYGRKLRLNQVLQEDSYISNSRPI